MFKILNLKEIRENEANLSQEELSSRINSILGQDSTSQSMISKYEANPEGIPAPIAHAWAKALGRESLFEENEDPGKIMVDPGKPYDDLERHLRLVEDYISLCSPTVSAHREGDFTKEKLLEMLRNIKSNRKPNLALQGAYDVGKSHLINSLLGNKCLPTGYQPMTRIPSLLIHIEDRPKEFTDTAYLLSPKFRLSKAFDQEHIKNCTELSGGLELLENYGTHKHEHEKGNNVEFAVVYLDAPLLRACNVIDPPGYEDKKEDEEKAEKISSHIDILLYLSQAKGFMKGFDITRFGHLWSKTRSYGYESFPKIGNLFIVASQADLSIKEDALNGDGGIIETVSDRIFKTIRDEVEKQAKRFGDITRDDIKHRIFPFWAEHEHRYKDLKNNLRSIVAEHIPLKKREQVDQIILDFKDRSQESLKGTIELFQSRINEFEKMKEHYKSTMAKEPERLESLKVLRKLIEERIVRYKVENLNEIGNIYRKFINENSLEGFIEKEFYQGKKEAKEYAVVRILDRLKSSVTKSAQVKAEELSKLIEEFIKDYETKAMALYPQEVAGGQSVRLPFDMKGAFLGGVAATGTFGALAAWVSTLGNLGGYILAAKATAVLAALGIPIGSGGAAGVMATIAAIGGPVVIGIGIAMVVGLLTWAIFGDSWQRRLAKKICSSFEENRILNNLRDWGTKYWDDTLIAFKSGADAIEEEYQNKLRDIKTLVEDPYTAKELEEKIQSLKAVQSFFANIPWRPTG